MEIQPQEKLELKRTIDYYQWQKVVEQIVNFR